MRYFFLSRSGMIKKTLRHCWSKCTFNHFTQHIDILHLSVRDAILWNVRAVRHLSQDWVVCKYLGRSEGTVSAHNASSKQTQWLEWKRFLHSARRWMFRFHHERFRIDCCESAPGSKEKCLNWRHPILEQIVCMDAYRTTNQILLANSGAGILPKERKCLTSKFNYR